MSLRYACRPEPDRPWPEALARLADAGWSGAVLVLDDADLGPDALARATALRARLDALGLGVLVRVGPAGGPTLVSATEADRQARLDRLRAAAGVARVLGAEALVTGSGPVPAGVDRPQAWRWLRDAAGLLAQGSDGVPVAWEPAPGDLVAHPGDWQRLQAAVPGVALALDAAHCAAAGPYPAEGALRVFAPHLGAVALADAPGGVDTPAVLEALRDVGWAGLVVAPPSPRPPDGRAGLTD